MLEHGTMYPYGLNDRLQPVGNVSHSSVHSRNNVLNLFNGHHSSLYNGGQGHGSLNRLLTTLHSARLRTLHKLFNECDQLIVANWEQRFRSMVLDVCSEKIFFPVRIGTNSTAKPPRRFIEVFFHNKGKLAAILHNRPVRSKGPIYFQEQGPPLVSYKYTNHISSSVFNYNQILRNINLNDYRNASSLCDCKSSAFRYEPHGHVITGDLRIVRNRQLRRLLEKGPKYREQNIIDWHLNKKILITAIDDYAKNWSKREGYHVSALEEWSETVKLIISNRIKKFATSKFRSLS